MAGADISELAALTPAETRSSGLRGQAVLRATGDVRQAFRSGGERVRTGRRHGTGDGLHGAVCEREREVRPAGSEARHDAGIWRHAATAAAGGPGAGLEMLLSGELIPAAEAYRIGLVNASCRRRSCWSHSRAWLAKVLANGPLALGMVMEAVDAGMSCRAGRRPALRGRLVRRQRGNGRPPGRNARVSGKAPRCIYRKVRHAESI